MTAPPVMDPTLESVLADQANEAIKRGADPKAVSDRLAVMVRHIRANPDVGQQGMDAIRKGADPAAVSKRVWDMAQPKEGESDPFVSRVIDAASTLGSNLVNHPLETAARVVTAPIQSAGRMLAPAVGERRVDARLSKGGNSSGRPIDTSPYDAEHGGVTDKERSAAIVQTLVNLAAPEFGPVVGGAMAGAAYSPEDPAVGAVLGAGAGTALKTVGAAGSAATRAARPAPSRGVQAVVDAAREAGFKPSAPSEDIRWMKLQSDKPVAPMDVLGKPGVRLARTARSASPQADQILTDAINTRNAGAVDRSIQDALEATGLQHRSSAFKTTEQLIEDRSAEGAKNYGKAFQDETPIDDPRISEILATPAGSEAWGRAMRTMRNKGITVPRATDAMAPPEGIKPDDWENMVRLAKEKGIAVPEGPSHVTPTLQQLHYLKLALDDVKQKGIDRGPGAGGIGYNEALSVADVQKQLLSVMDENSEQYRHARATHADKSALLDANKLGQQLFKMQPEEAAAAMRDLGSEAERTVFRRAGMDALADRLENGPQDPNKAVGKVRDQRRIRLLFPDDDSFARFRRSIEKEAQMLANGKEVTGGSQTADKLADLAQTLDLPVSQLLSAAGGNVGPLARFGVTAAARARSLTTRRSTATEIAKLLSSGMEGDAGRRSAAMDAIIAEDAKPHRTSRAIRMLPVGTITNDSRSQHP